MADGFRSLKNYNFRLWASGGLISNVGTWFQRIAQDWLVLTELTHHNATALGFVMALQTGPMLLLMPMTGYVADHYDRRKLLMATQGCSAMLAVVLGSLTVAGLVELWHVYVLATLLGCVSAFDAPVRQVFVSELVDEEDLANAVALNATSFNSARMIGPALAGVVIAALGSGWAILLNAASFAAVLISMLLLRQDDLRKHVKPTLSRSGFVDGFRYVWKRPDLKVVLLMTFLIGAFALNFPIFVSTMAVSIFHAGAAGYGTLMSIMAIGSIAGSLLSAHQAKPRIALLMGSAIAFAVGLGAAALAPAYWFFAAALVVIGVAAVNFTTSTSSFMQLATDPSMRGRVISIRLAVGMGTTPIGAPVVGWVADTLGARWAIAIGVVSCIAAAAIAALYETKAGLEPREPGQPGA
jgi:MFS family permease